MLRMMMFTYLAENTLLLTKQATMSLSLVTMYIYQVAISIHLVVGILEHKIQQVTLEFQSWNSPHYYSPNN